MLNIRCCWEGIDFQKYIIYIQNLRNSCKSCSTQLLVFCSCKKPFGFCGLFFKPKITFNFFRNFYVFFSTPLQFNAQEKNSPTAKSNQPKWPLNPSSKSTWLTNPQEVDDSCRAYMGVSENSGFYPQIIQFNRVFHYKPSILGYLYFWKHPYELCGGNSNIFYFHPDPWGFMIQFDDCANIVQMGGEKYHQAVKSIHRCFLCHLLGYWLPCL